MKACPNNQTNKSAEKQKKYDYLNKYSQHQILEETYEREAAYHKCKDSDYRIERTADSPRQVFNSIPDFTSNHSLSSEIASQNQILRKQVAEYRVLVVKLQRQIEKQGQQLKGIRQIMKNERISNEVHIHNLQQQQRYYENKTHQIEQELRDYKARYQVLNKDLIELTMNNEIRQNNKSNFQQECLTQINNWKQFSSKINDILCLGSRTTEQQVLACLSETVKSNKTYEDLIGNICKMYRKINNCALVSKDLHVVWKWLKQLGATYQCIAEAKDILVERKVLRSDAQVQEILQHLLAANL